MTGFSESREIPLVFDCQGDDLGGGGSLPRIAGPGGCYHRGGGRTPVSRGGMGRGLVSMARALCDRGIAVLRFDHRGLG